MDRWVTVYDMHEEIKDLQIKLLSTFNAEFWTEYKENFEEYDEAFVRLYKYFRYFDQDLSNDEDVMGITIRFISEVKHHLMLNEKKYEELYRVHILENQDYDFKGNVNYTRQENETKNGTGSYVSGQRQDSTTDTIGTRHDTSEEQVSAFDSQSYAPSNKTIDDIGQQQNTETLTKGAQTDSTTNAEINSKTITIKGKDSDTSISSMISGHIKMWDKYEFYSYIFKEIAKELLLV